MEGLKIIIADDEALIRLDLREMLTEAGHTVLGEASDGEEAVELARRLKPDLVIMDVKMPKMDGITAAGIITGQHIAPVLLLTAYSQQDVVERANSSGVMAYLVKPVREEQLFATMQEKGYAESDPTADVGGLDAARKLVILASIAFNTRISLDDVLVSGIESLKLCDIEYAKELGYTIKLLAVAKHDEEKGITVCVRPTMLPTEHPLAGVNDVFNAVFVEGDALGEAMFMGRGAGGLPTASAVCGDIIDVARNMVHGSTGRINCTCFDEKHLCRLEDMLSPFYIRLHVVDRPGVLAAIAAAFAAQNVGLKKVIQKQMVGDKLAELVVITYHVSELDMQMAVQTLKGLPVIKEVCSVIHVEDDNVE